MGRPADHCAGHARYSRQALQPTSPFPLDLAVALPGLDLDLSGTIAEPAEGRGLDLRLAGRSDDIRPLLERLDSKAPLAGRAEGAVTLRGDFDAVQIPDLRLTVGDPATRRGQRRDRDLCAPARHDRSKASRSSSRARPPRRVSRPGSTGRCPISARLRVSSS